MKSIITLSLALVATFATQASTNSGLSELDTVTGFGGGTAVSHFVNEETVLNPSAYIATGYLKSTDEVIADNKTITDFQETESQPLYFETSVNEINENNRIVDAQMPDYAPLDFNYINKRKAQPVLPSALPQL